MDFLKKGWRVCTYLFQKLASASLVATFYFTFILLSDFDLYKLSIEMDRPVYWIGFFVYAIICSIIIDKVSLRFPKRELVFYLIAGLLFLVPFIGKEKWLLSLLASVLCAILFFVANRLTKRWNGVKWTFVGIFVVLLGLSIPDFTIKKEWNKVVGNQAYAAYFSYFNGEHRIPIEGKAGEKLIITIDVKKENGGGYRYHLIDTNKKLVDWEQTNDNQLEVELNQTGTYELVIIGDGLRGGFEVNWEMEDGGESE